METQVVMTDLAFPTGSRVVMNVQVSADFNISAQVARQKANRWLIMNLGDQLWAGEPELLIGSRLVWRLPVHLSLSSAGYLGQIGELCVDAQTGDISVGAPQTIEQMAEQAEALYERAVLPTRAR
jgi:hypothetical protein